MTTQTNRRKGQRERHFFELILIIESIHIYIYIYIYILFF